MVGNAAFQLKSVGPTSLQYGHQVCGTNKSAIRPTKSVGPTSLQYGPPSLWDQQVCNTAIKSAIRPTKSVGLSSLQYGPPSLRAHQVREPIKSKGPPSLWDHQVGGPSKSMTRPARGSTADFKPVSTSAECCMPRMVPLATSTPRDENPSSAFEEFATHLSLYDDGFSMVERSLPALVDTKGPVPPSVFCPASRTSADVTGQVKVKRKCGRPRNPIPRHKRESHINAEHRRRGKIQDGFRTLKNIVPKYEQTSGRDSKADILFKAVDYSKLLQNDINELRRSMEALRAERDLLALDIKSYQSLVPDVCPYTDLPVSLDECFDEYVQQRSSESWTFGTFKAIMFPLFESYKLSVQGESMTEFLCSVADWASRSLSASNLSAVCATALRDTCKQTPGLPGPFTGDSLLDSNSNFRSAERVGHSLVSDSSSNNNHESSNSSQNFHNQAFPSEQFGCRDGLGCGSNNGLGTASLEMYVNEFNNSHALPTNNSPTNNSPTNKDGAKLSPQSAQDLAPFSGTCNTNSANNIFSDLYYNLDHNLHDHHLSRARAGIDGSDHWPHLYLRQHHWQHYQNNNLSPPSYFHNLTRNKSSLWRSPHSGMLGRGSEDMTALAPRYEARPFPGREFREEDCTPREAAGMLSPTSRPYLGPTQFTSHERGRPKRPSQSSSEGEGSLLNMETCMKQSAETTGENGQLSPSTDSGVSPGSSMCVTSPGVLAGRSAFAYPSSSSLDQLKVHKHLMNERLDYLDNQLTVTLPSYKDTFGSRKVEKLTPQRHFNEVTWATDTHIAGSRQEPSTLLAQMLGQTGSTSPTQLAQMLGQTGSTSPTQLAQKVGPMARMAPRSPSSIASQNSLNLLHVHSPTATRNMTSFPGDFPAQIKLEADCRLPSLADQTVSADPRKPPCFPTESQQTYFSHQANASQPNYFPWQAFPDESKHGSDWRQHCHQPHDSSGLESQRAAVLGDAHEAMDQISYFEMAHQQLLNHQGLSQNRISELTSPERGMSLAQAHLLTSSHKADIYRTDLNAHSLSPPNERQTNVGLWPADQSRLSGQTQGHALFKQRSARRRSSMEAENDEAHLLRSFGDSKRTCSWRHEEEPCQDPKGRPCISNAASKMCVPTFDNSVTSP